jgi:single-strand DNA-binding protein
MASYNKITLIGNVGRDPEVRNVGGDKKVADFSIAVNDAFTDKSGQRQEKTEWFRVSFWNQRADVIEKYVKKGTQIFVEGKLSVRSYTDKDGKERYSLDVLGSDFTLLGGRNEGDNAGGYNSNQNSGSYSTSQSPRDIPSSLQSGDDDLPF